MNKCKELKNEWNFTAFKAITDMVIKEITSLGVEPQPPEL
jgi:hypothetical protein